MKVVSLLSGGLDSSVLAYKLRAEHDLVGLVSINYDQRHKRELQYARQTALRLHVPFHLVDLKSVNPLIRGSALTDPSLKVPEGHYAEDSMKATVVPNRNAIMLSILWAHAVAIGADAVAIGAHSGDHQVYPDCRQEFFQSLKHALNEGNIWAGYKELLTPFITWSKADIVTEGARLKVPFELSYSCYVGAEKHCGRCGTCCERAESFFLAGVGDPTTYTDPHFWKTVCHVEG